MVRVCDPLCFGRSSYRCRVPTRPEIRTRIWGAVSIVSRDSGGEYDTGREARARAQGEEGSPGQISRQTCGRGGCGRRRYGELRTDGLCLVSLEIPTRSQRRRGYRRRHCALGRCVYRDLVDVEAKYSSSRTKPSRRKTPGSSGLRIRELVYLIAAGTGFTSSARFSRLSTELASSSYNVESFSRLAM